MMLVSKYDKVFLKTNALREKHFPLKHSGRCAVKTTDLGLTAPQTQDGQVPEQRGL
jgi:hypothetical protein